MENFAEIRESLSSESKSTAGDKHETGRAMVQLELEQAGKIVHENEQLMNAFQKLSFRQSDTVIPGSLIFTDSGIFFITVPLGKIHFDESAVFCIGTQAPLYKLFAGKKAGDHVVYGDRKYVLERIE